jgi:hypothetical protein
VTVSNVVGIAMPAVSVGASPYAVTLNSTDHTHRPDRLTITWTGEVSTADVTVSTTVEIVGSLPADLTAIRSTPSTTAAGSFTDDRLKQFREEFLDLCDEYLSWSPVRRVRTQHVPAYTRTVVLDRDDATVRAIYDADDAVHTFEQDGPTVTLDAWSSDPLTIVYTHGAPQSPPAISEACVVYCRHAANSEAGGIERTAISYADGAGGTTRFSLADWARKKPTGVESIDRRLNQFLTHRVPLVG